MAKNKTRIRQKKIH